MGFFLKFFFKIWAREKNIENPKGFLEEKEYKPGEKAAPWSNYEKDRYKIHVPISDSQVGKVYLCHNTRKTVLDLRWGNGYSDMNQQEYYFVKWGGCSLSNYSWFCYRLTKRPKVKSKIGKQETTGERRKIKMLLTRQSFFY